MLPITIPIVQPQVGWEELKNALSRTVEGNLKYGENISDFLLLFEGTKITDLREITNPLNHISYSFLVICFKETLYSLIQEIGNLSFYTFPTKQSGIIGVILSGNLTSWKWVIVNAKEDEVGAIFNQCLIHFERIGLGQIWGNYRKIGTKSHFRLELK